MFDFSESRIIRLVAEKRDLEKSCELLYLDYVLIN